MRTEQKVAVITGASQGIGADALAYAQEMSNPPQTLSGIEDSVVGLPARMLDRDARSYALIARVFASQPEGLRDDILENVTLYWLTNTAVSSARLYWESKLAFFAPKGVAIPDAVSAFPDEIYTTPRSLRPLRRWLFSDSLQFSRQARRHNTFVARRGSGKADELTGDCFDDHHFRHAYVNHPRYLE